MANEFITRNGLISLSNATITGSLIVTGSTTLVGPTVLSGSLLVSGSSNLLGNSTITGSLIVSGLSTFSGNISGSQPTSNPSSSLILISGSITPTGSALGSSAVLINTVMSASANNQTLVGLDIQPTFVSSSYTSSGYFGVGVKIRMTGSFNSGNAYFPLLVQSQNGSQEMFTMQCFEGNPSITDLMGPGGTTLRFQSNGTISVYPPFTSQTSLICTTYSSTGPVPLTITTYSSQSPNCININSPSTAGGYMAVKGNGNILMNTTVDNGYKLQVYQSGSTSTSGSLYVSGSLLTTGSDATINSLTVGLGGGQVATNTAIGYQAMINATTASNSNVGIGYQSFTNAGNSTNSVAVGYQTLTNGGAQNVAIGAGAMKNAAGAYQNVAVGFNTMQVITTGQTNVGVGRAVLSSLSTGNGNTAIGNGAMGGGNSSYNTAVGFSSLQPGGGTYNAAFGANSMIGNSAGSNNTSIGGYANYTLSGVLYGTSSINANNSIFIGYNSSTILENQTNQIVIGYNGLGNGSNTTVLGNTSTTQTQIFGNTLHSNTPQQSDNGAKLQVYGSTTISNNLTVAGSATANSFIKSGGTSSQFLKADGSVDSSTYLTTGNASSTYLPLSGGTLTGALTGSSATFSSTVTANSFSGAGTGLTGTASSLTVGNSTQWNGQNINTGTNYPSPLYFMTTTGAPNWGYSTVANIQSALGLGSNAYSSTAYLPLSGGTLTGNLLIGTTTDNGNKLQVNGSSTFAGAMNIAYGYSSVVGGQILVEDGNGNGEIRIYSPTGGSPNTLIWALRNNRTSFSLAHANVNRGSDVASSFTDMFVLTNSGNATISGTVTATGGGFDSDLTLKNIISRDYSSHRIADKISPIIYTWKDETKNQTERFGYGAQEVQELLPQAVYTNGETLAVDYTQVHTVLIDDNTKRIQELEQQIKELKAIINELGRTK